MECGDLIRYSILDPLLLVAPVALAGTMQSTPPHRVGVVLLDIKAWAMPATPGLPAIPNSGVTTIRSSANQLHSPPYGDRSEGSKYTEKYK